MCPIVRLGQSFLELTLIISSLTNASELDIQYLFFTFRSFVRIMKAGITLEFKEVCQRVSQHMIANMDKLRINRLKDGVAPGAGVKWTAARTLD